jgi:hypothetical protein
MDYQKIYDSIIERGKNRILNEYREKHHIIPRCMGGTNDSENIVELTPEEHYVCHQLLVKLYPTNSSLIFAANMLTVPSKYVKRNNKVYGWLKRKFIEQNSGDNHSLRKNKIARKKNQEYMRGPNNPQKLNPVRGINHHAFGKPLSPNHFTEDGRKVLRDKMLGSKNPCAGVKPWIHPRTTDTTRALWKRADEIYKIWLENDKPSYCKLYGLAMNKSYDWKTGGKEVSPFMNMVKYFRNGWIPTEDTEWNKNK